MSKRLVALAVACVAVAAIALLARRHIRPATPPVPPEARLFDADRNPEFRTKWDDGGSTGAKYEYDAEHRLRITGTEKAKTYGSIYTDIVIDLDQYAEIEVDVDTVSKGGYILLQGAAFEEGYVSLGPSISGPGVAVYDLRLQTGFTSGKLPVRLQIGVTTNSAEGSADGLTMTLKSIHLIPRAPGSSSAGGDVLFLHAPGEGAGSVHRFSAKWDDGTAAGATASTDGKDLVIEGTSTKDQYGAVVVNATVDLDRLGGLAVDVKEVTRAGYVVLQHPDLPGGFVRAQPEITKPGHYDFDMRRLLGRAGLMSFRILFGVTTQGTEPRVAGQRMVLTRVALGPSPLRAIDRVRRADRPSLIAMPPPPEGSPWPTASSLRPAGSMLPGIEALKPVAALVAMKGDRVTVRGGMTELTLSATAPRVLAVKDLAANKDVSSGGALFAVETLDGGLVDAAEAVRAGKAKCEAKIEPGAARYHVVFDAYTVDVAVTPKDGGVALSADVASTTQRVLGVMLPGKFGFPVANLKEVVIPRWLGIGLEPNFFRDERTASFNYPAGFSDLVHASFGAGNLAIAGGGVATRGLASAGERKGNLMRYSGEGIAGGEWTGFRPATISVGGENVGGSSTGFITRVIPARIDPGQTLSTGDVVIEAGLPLASAAALYRREHFEETVKPLADRMGEKLFGRYSRAALLKLDFGGYPDLDRILDDVNALPEGLLLHPVTYWEGGFDHNYPDFFPAAAKFGGDGGLKRLTGLAHGKRMLVAPYVNPTWWNISKTANLVGLEKIAIRDEEDKPVEDVYGENKGWMVTPWSDAVRDVRRKLHNTAYDVLGMDGLFEDQIGARDWKDDYSRNAPAPFSYSEGMVRWAAENPHGGILMTENGFDALAPFEHSLCGMWPVGSWPDGGDLDARYGRDNWRVVPVSAMIAHDLADFLHHNLAVETRTDGDGKLAWNLAYGFHLFEILYANLPRQQARWIAICQAFQDEVASLSTGRKLVAWSAGPGSEVWTEYDGGLAVFANMSGAPRAIAGAVLGGPGVIASVDAAQPMTAGIFTAMAGFDFGMPRHIIMKRRAEARSLDVTIPDEKRGLVSLPRDPAWRNDAAITVEALDGTEAHAIECATTSRAVVFLHRPGHDGIGRYRVSGAPGDTTAEWFARIRTDERVTAGTTTRVRFEIFSGGKPLSLKSSGVATWTVSRTGPAPDRALPVKVDESPLNLRSGEWGGGSFEIDLPEDVTPGEYLWVEARLATDRGEKIVAAIAPIDPGMIVACEAETVVRMAAVVPVRASLTNRMARDVTGRLELLVDRTTTATPYTSDITVKSGGSWTGSIPVAALSRGAHKIIVRFQTAEGIVVPSAPLDITAVEPLRSIDLDGRNLIPASGMIVRLHLVAPQGRGYRGTALFAGEGGWSASPASVNVVVPPGGEVNIPVRIIPGSAIEGKIIVRVTGPDGEVSHVEPYKKLTGAGAILMADLNGDGLNEIAFGHENFEAQCAIAGGGRILLLAGRDGVNHLFLRYPPLEPPADPRAWTELGGINDWWPRGWPGDVWNNEWRIETRDDAEGVHVTMTSASQEGLTIRRAMTIRPGSNMVACEYEINNPTAQPVTQTWAAHPDIAIGPNGAGREDMIVVPTERGLRQHEYRPRLSKVDFFRPTEGWAAAEDRTSGDFIAVLYEQGVLSEFGMWEGIGFFTLEPIRAPSTLAPGAKETFRIGYGLGRGDPALSAPAMASQLAGK